MSIGTNGSVQQYSQEDLNRLAHELTSNVIMSRSQMWSKLLDPRRSIDDECGYPKGTVGAETYQGLYDREPIATRVVELMPKETWQVSPTVYEDEDPDTVTPFERRWQEINDTIRGEESWFQDEEGAPIWEYLQRADILSGVGQYGVLLLGLDDGEDDLTKPVTSAKDLTFIGVYPESLARIIRLDRDRKSKRYGRPEMYSITFNDPYTQSPKATIGALMETRDVHHSRVLHVADNLFSSEVYGIPRQQPVLNPIMDIQKVRGGSAEMYWRGAFPGLSLETHPQLSLMSGGGKVKVDQQGMRDMMEQYFNGLQRYLSLTGYSAKTLSPTVVDPTPQIAAYIEAICIKLGCPVRIFKGSERGELASSQDDAAWNDRLRFRQANYVTPRIIVPFVDKLIRLGVLPKPAKTKKEVTANKKNGLITVNKFGRRLLVNAETGKVEGEESQGGYSIHWPDLTSQTQQEKAEVASKKTAALAAYVAGQVETIMPPQDYYTAIMGMDEEEATAILENAADLKEERMDEQEEQQAKQMDMTEEQIDRGLMPDPTKRIEQSSTSERMAKPGGFGGPKPPGGSAAVPGKPKLPKPPAVNEWIGTAKAFNAKLSGGRWVTTDEGHHIYLKGGKPIAGNPKVLAEIKGKSLASPKKSEDTEEAARHKFREQVAKDLPSAQDVKKAEAAREAKKPTKIPEAKEPPKKAGVSVKDKTTADKIKELTGQSDPAKLARAAGATHDADVKMEYKNGQVEINVVHDDYTSIRYLKKEGGELVMTNAEIKVHKKGTGQGTEIFAEQVKHAEELGVSKIKAVAAGSKGSKYNGYYTWPRLGYDQDLSDDIPMKNSARAELTTKFPKAKSVGDLMTTKEGREWWQENGADLDFATFDLKKGSRSRKVLDAYIEERKTRNPK